MTNYQPKKKYLSQLRHHHEDAPSQQVLMEGVQEEDSLQLQQQHLQNLQQQDNLQQQQLLQQQNLQRLNYNRSNVDNNNNTQVTDTTKNNDDQGNKNNNTDNLPSPSNHLSPSTNHITSPSSSLMMMNLSDPAYNKEVINKLQQQNFNFNNTHNNTNNNYIPCNNLPRIINSINFNRFSDSYLWSQQQQQQCNIINKNIQQQQFFNRNLQQQQQHYHHNDNNNNQPPALQPIDDPSIHSPHHSYMHTMHSSHPQDTISPRSTSDELSVLNIKEELHNNHNNLSEDNKFCLNNNNNIMMSPSRQSLQQQQQLSPHYYNNSQGNIQENTHKSSANDSIDSMVASNQTAAQQQLLQQLKPLLTSSGRNKGSGKPIEPKHLCQVCGDLAAGFHCGAYVCEACKKFFLRCLKTGRGMMFLCPKNNNCEITKETRSHCQRCRYQRCIELSMYKPGREDDKKLKVDFRSIPCKVCKAPSSGFHFGAITCEGCKGFFRRMLKEQVHRKFVCSNDERCNIDSANRTTCKSCRFTKCLKIGMTLEGTRLGRQSNSVKRGVIIQCLTSRKQLFAERSFSVDAIAPDRVSTTTIGSTQLSPLTQSSSLTTDNPSALRRLLSNMEFNKNRANYQSVDDEEEEDDDDDDFDDDSDRNNNVNDKSASDNTNNNNSPSINLTVSSNDDDVFVNNLSTLPLPTTPSETNNNMPYLFNVEQQQVVQQQQQLQQHRLLLLNYNELNSLQQQQHKSNDSEHFYHNSINPLSQASKENKMASEVMLKSEPTEQMDDSLPRLVLNNLPSFSSSQSQSNLELPTNQSHVSSCSLSQLYRELSEDSVLIGELKGVDKGLFKQPSLLFTHLTNAYRQLNDIWIRPQELDELMYCQATLNTIWKLVEIPFNHMVKLATRFFLHVPGFTNLGDSDKVCMIKNSVYPLWLIYHSANYNLEDQEYNWFTSTNKERDLIMAYIRPLTLLVNHFKSTGFSTKILNLNEAELSFLAAMTLLSSSDKSSLESPDEVFDLQDHLLEAFSVYLEAVYSDNNDYLNDAMTDDSGLLATTNHVNPPTRIAILLARLAELKRANIEHISAANQIVRTFPNISTGALWREVLNVKQPEDDWSVNEAAL